MKGTQLETLCCGTPGFIAPEVLNKEGYGLKADIFSCGIIAYFLYYKFFIIRLTGVSPFNSKTKEEIIAKNKKGIIPFPEDIWKNVSSEAKDFVMRLTVRDQYKRLSAKECLEHKWLESGISNSSPLQLADMDTELSNEMY